MSKLSVAGDVVLLVGVVSFVSVVDLAFSRAVAGVPCQELGNGAVISHHGVEQGPVGRFIATYRRGEAQAFLPHVIDKLGHRFAFGLILMIEVVGCVRVSERLNGLVERIQEALAFNVLSRRQIIDIVRKAVLKIAKSFANGAERAGVDALL